MNVKIRVSSILVFFMMVVSCSTTPSGLPEKSSNLPEKYNLDDQLKSVNEIMRVKKSSFEEVDDQSVILQANRNEYYLLVLDMPIDPYISKQRTIGVESTEHSIPAGIGRIYIRHSSGTQYYVIEKIYRLKGKKQVEEIKERLRKS
ncbi:MAG: hypothetical protein JW896_18450 [Deltaproteobacteria bacterium]|nr:hypothetical protein [Deltaproteobacteria bacterium]